MMEVARRRRRRRWRTRRRRRRWQGKPSQGRLQPQNEGKSTAAAHSFLLFHCVQFCFNPTWKRSCRNKKRGYLTVKLTVTPATYLRSGKKTWWTFEFVSLSDLDNKCFGNWEDPSVRPLSYDERIVPGVRSQSASSYEFPTAQEG